MTPAEILRKWLVVLGAVVLAFNAMRIVHECGHLLAAMATGGQALGITMNPVGWCYALAHGGADHAFSWGGLVTEPVAGLAILALVWSFAKRLSAIGLLVGIIALAETGLYMLAGAIGGQGDPAHLIAMGIPAMVFYVTGSVLILLALPLILPAGAAIGIGRGRCRLPTTFLVLSPILLYALAPVVWSLARGKLLKTTGLVDGAGGVAVILLAVVMIHFGSRRFHRPSFAPRMMPTGWAAAILLPLLGGALVAAELIWMQAPARPNVFAKLTWLADENHYAGAYQKLPLSDADWPDGGVFWRDGGDLQQIPLGKAEVLDVKPWPRVGAFLVARQDGLFALDKDRHLTPVWTAADRITRYWTNDAVTRAIAVQMPHAVVAVDLASGKSERLPLPASQGLIASRAPSSVPGGSIVGAARGRCVWAKPTGGGGTMLIWNDQRMLLTERVVWAGADAVAGKSPLWAISSRAAVYRIDGPEDFARFDSPKTFTAQFGLCPAGLWMALDDKATVKVCGASEKTFRVDLPVGPK
ncbi:MAG: hypothetical protein NT031_20005 [Planctomycetota bacterium]|nr:hypothetical protein [Planctomycetota bacterium]